MTLDMLDKIKGHLNAYTWLKDDHTSSPKVIALTETVKKMNNSYRDKISGIYSFGGQYRAIDFGNVMKDLIEIRKSVIAE